MQELRFQFRFLKTSIRSSPTYRTIPYTLGVNSVPVLVGHFRLSWLPFISAPFVTGINLSFYISVYQVSHKILNNSNGAVGCSSEIK